MSKTEMQSRAGEDASPVAEVKNAVSGQGIRIGPVFAEDGFAQIVKEYVLDH